MKIVARTITFLFVAAIAFQNCAEKNSTTDDRINILSIEEKFLKQLDTGFSCDVNGDPCGAMVRKSRLDGGAWTFYVEFSTADRECVYSVEDISFEKQYDEAYIIRGFWKFWACKTDPYWTTPQECEFNQQIYATNGNCPVVTSLRIVPIENDCFRYENAVSGDHVYCPNEN